MPSERVQEAREACAFWGPDQSDAKVAHRRANFDADLDALIAAVRAEALAEVREGVWQGEHLGSCPASTNVPGGGPLDRMWCDCGYERFAALAQLEAK